MESKKLSKKLNTIFWYVLYTLPLVLLFFYLVSCCFAINQTGETISFESFSYMSYSFVIDGFVDTLWFPIFNAVSNLAITLGFNVDSYGLSFLCIILCWFIQTNFLHVLVDVLLFIPRLFHNIMERWS